MALTAESCCCIWSRNLLGGDDYDFELEGIAEPNLSEALACYSCFRHLRFRSRYSRHLDDEHHQPIDIAPLLDINGGHAAVFLIYSAGGSPGGHS